MYFSACAWQSMKLCLKSKRVKEIFFSHLHFGWMLAALLLIGCIWLWGSEFTGGLGLFITWWQPRSVKPFSLTWIRPWNPPASASAYSVENIALSFLTHAGNVLLNWTFSLVLLYKSCLILSVLPLKVLHSCLVLLISCHPHVTPPSRPATSTLLFC